MLMCEVIMMHNNIKKDDTQQIPLPHQSDVLYQPTLPEHKERM